MGYARLWDSVDSIKLSQPIARRSDLLTSFKNHDDIHHVLAVTGGYYVIETSEQNLVIKDARFGIISGWNFPSETSFIFNYNLNLANNTWSQSRPAMPHASYLFKSLARAIFK